MFGIRGLPEFAEGMDVGRLTAEAAVRQGTPILDGDIVVVTQKAVSKAEGRVVDPRGVEPSPFALAHAERWGKDARQTEVVLRESRRVVRMVGPLIIAETHHGFVCANAGVDASNASTAGLLTLLPLDPDASARRIREALRTELGVRAAVIISDTFGRPWREGLTNVAIGIAGMRPLLDYTGRSDDTGYELRVTVLAAADELASAAELVMGKLERVPVAVIRGYRYEEDEMATIAPIIREASRDLFQ